MNSVAFEDVKKKIEMSNMYKYVNKEKLSRVYEKIKVNQNSSEQSIMNQILIEYSSISDANGKKVTGGIKGMGRYKYSDFINQACTDYLSNKITHNGDVVSKKGQKFFSKLDSILIRYSQDENVLMQIYLNEDVRIIRKFLNTYGDSNTFENIYDNFLFLDDNDLNNILNKIEKNVISYLKQKRKEEKKQHIINKIRNIFIKSKVKLITNETNKRDKNREFLYKNKYEIKRTIDDDIKLYGEQNKEIDEKINERE